MDINKMKSDLKMENFHFVECSITRSQVIENGPLSFDLQKEINELEDGSYTVILTLVVKKEKKRFECESNSFGKVFDG